MKSFRRVAALSVALLASTLSAAPSLDVATPALESAAPAFAVMPALGLVAPATVAVSKAVSGLSFESSAYATTPIHYYDTVAFAGDSITAGAYYNQTGSFLPLIQAAIPTITIRTAATATGGVATATGGVGHDAGQSIHPVVTNIDSGLAGSTAADWAASGAAMTVTRVTNYNPQVVVVGLGINDVRTPFTAAAYRANVDIILDKINTVCPNAQILIWGVLGNGEQWASGPLRWSNAAYAPPGYVIDTQVDDYNTQMAASCAAHTKCQFVDMRSHWLTLEQTTNTPEPGAANGVYSLDGVHPNPAGQTMMGSYLFTTVTISP